VLASVHVSARQRHRMHPPAAPYATPVRSSDKIVSDDPGEVSPEKPPCTLVMQRSHHLYWVSGETCTAATAARLVILARYGRFYPTDGERRPNGQPLGREHKPSRARGPRFIRSASVSRRPNDQPFTKTAVRRLMKIADGQGVKNYRIAIGSENGKPVYSLIVNNAVSATESDTNPWDEVLTDAAHEKRPA